MRLLHDTGAVAASVSSKWARFSSRFALRIFKYSSRMVSIDSGPVLNTLLINVATTQRGYWLLDHAFFNYPQLVFACPCHGYETTRHTVSKFYGEYQRHEDWETGYRTYLLLRGHISLAHKTWLLWEDYPLLCEKGRSWWLSETDVRSGSSESDSLNLWRKSASSLTVSSLPPCLLLQYQERLAHGLSSR